MSMTMALAVAFALASFTGCGAGQQTEPSGTTKPTGTTGTTEPSGTVGTTEPTGTTEPAGTTEPSGTTGPSDTAELFESLSALVNCVNTLHPDGRYEGYYLYASTDTDNPGIALLNYDLTAPYVPPFGSGNHEEHLSYGYGYNNEYWPDRLVYTMSLFQDGVHFSAFFAHDTLAQIRVEPDSTWFLPVDRQEGIANRLAVISSLIEEGRRCQV
jgi:hypothetical protein